MAQDNSNMIYKTTNLKNDGGLLLPSAFLHFSTSKTFKTSNTSQLIWIRTTNLKNDGGLLLPRDLVVVALHQQRWWDVHLAHVHLDIDHDHDEDEDGDGDGDDGNYRMFILLISTLIMMMMGTIYNNHEQS